VIRTLPAIATLAMVAALAVAGCGSSDSGSGGAYGRGPEITTGTQGGSGGSKPVATESTVVSAAKNPQLGTILVTAKGLTLYDFHKDKGGKSACYGACAGTWPPLTTSAAPHATNGATASRLGTVKRSDGTMQVTYAGHPLYTYVADTKPGDTKGNDFSSFGAEWYALQPNGQEPED
jgi:predicted lipoprotein with Yx(FWY)xxD motif